MEKYTLFLLAESKYSGCCRLAEILDGLSHDSVNRFLLREKYEPKDLFNELKLHIELIGGTLSGDDTVIEKPFDNWYEIKLNLSVQVARDSILNYLNQKVGLKAEY